MSKALCPYCEEEMEFQKEEKRYRCTKCSNHFKFDEIEKPKHIIDVKQNDGMKVVAGDSIGYFSTSEKELRDGNYFTGCYAGMLHVGILSNGGVIGCLALPHIERFIEGNVRERPLTDIWFDGNSFSYNRNFSEELLEGACKNCDYGKICRAGCKSSAFGATGNEHDNPYCTYGVESCNKMKIGG